MSTNPEEPTPLEKMIYAPRQNPKKSISNTDSNSEMLIPTENFGEKKNRKRKLPKIKTFFKIFLTLMLLLLLMFSWFLFKTNKNMQKIDALENYSERIGETPGTNWLLVGSDSRETLSAKEEHELSTGDVAGTGRTDTILLFHLPKNLSKPTLISIPRDLLFQIPNIGENKINSAFAFGGPTLLVQTIENETKIHIDHYLEINFSGLNKLVNAIGGVNICIPNNINDPLAGINLKKGCQKLNGKKALGFTRSRATPRADLDRVVNQRLFLEALIKQISSPKTLLNIFKLNSLASDGIKSLTFDKRDNVFDLVYLAFKAKNGYVSITTPTGLSVNSYYGNALNWSEDTNIFFQKIAKDESVEEFQNKEN